MKQERYTVVQETERTRQIANRPTFKQVMFLGKYKEKEYFCGYKILTAGVFVTQLSSDAGISV